MIRELSTNQPIASGTVTLANMKISAVDGGAEPSGGAFVDFGVVDVLTGKLGCLLRITSVSNGATIQGIIKAAGTAETYDTEIVSNGAFETDPNVQWTIVSARCTLASVAGGQVSNCLEVTQVVAASQYIYQNFTGVVGALYNFSRYLKSGTAGNIDSNAGIASTNYASDKKNIAIASSGSWVQGTFYWTADVTGLSIALRKSIGAGTQLFDEVSLKKVLTPSTTGCTIVNSKGGVTYNWINKSSSFDYASATFTYEIYRIPPVVVATADVTQAHFHADLTTDNAFVELIGVDFTAYQTGKYLLGIYNKTGGYGMLGHISATAPAGETLATTGGPLNNGEQFTNPTFDSGDTGWLKETGWTIEDQGGGDYEGVANVNTNYAIYQNKLLTVGTLNKIACDQTSQTSGTGAFDFAATVGITILNGVASYSEYRTSLGISKAYGVLGRTAWVARIDSVSLKQVTDPPSTGARIVSTKGGATRAFYYKHASFNPNDTAGQTYKIYYLGD